MIRSVLKYVSLNATICHSCSHLASCAGVVAPGPSGHTTLVQALLITWTWTPRRQIIPCCSFSPQNNWKQHEATLHTSWTHIMKTVWSNVNTLRRGIRHETNTLQIGQPNWSCNQHVVECWQGEMFFYSSSPVRFQTWDQLSQLSLLDNMLNTHATFNRHSGQQVLCPLEPQLPSFHPKSQRTSSSMSPCQYTSSNLTSYPEIKTSILAAHRLWHKFAFHIFHFNAKTSEPPTVLCDRMPQQ